MQTALRKSLKISFFPILSTPKCHFQRWGKSRQITSQETPLLQLVAEATSFEASVCLLTVFADSFQLVVRRFWTDAYLRTADLAHDASIIFISKIFASSADMLHSERKYTRRMCELYLNYRSIRHGGSKAAQNYSRWITRSQPRQYIASFSQNR